MLAQQTTFFPPCLRLKRDFCWVHVLGTVFFHVFIANYKNKCLPCYPPFPTPFHSFLVDFTGVLFGFQWINTSSTSTLLNSTTLFLLINGSSPQLQGNQAEVHFQNRDLYNRRCMKPGQFIQFSEELVSESEVLLVSLLSWPPKIQGTQGSLHSGFFLLQLKQIYSLSQKESVLLPRLWGKISQLFNSLIS